MQASRAVKGLQVETRLGNVGPRKYKLAGVSFKTASNAMYAPLHWLSVWRMGKE